VPASRATSSRGALPPRTRRDNAAPTYYRHGVDAPRKRRASPRATASSLAAGENANDNERYIQWDTHHATCLGHSAWLPGWIHMPCLLGPPLATQHPPTTCPPPTPTYHPCRRLPLLPPPTTPTALHHTTSPLPTPPLPSYPYRTIPPTRRLWQGRNGPAGTLLFWHPCLGGRTNGGTAPALLLPPATTTYLAPHTRLPRAHTRTRHAGYTLLPAPLYATHCYAHPHHHHRTYTHLRLEPKSGRQGQNKRTGWR